MLSDTKSLSADQQNDFEHWVWRWMIVGDGHFIPVADAWKMYKARRRYYDHPLTYSQFLKAMEASGFKRVRRKIYYKRIPVFIGVAVGDFITRLVYAMARCEAEVEAMNAEAA